MAPASRPPFLFRLSDTISEWTPLALLALYSIFTFFLYILLPNKVTAALWYVYLAMQTFVSLTVLGEAIQSIRPNVLARRARRKAAVEGFPDLTERTCPPVDVVLVAYLPNEKDIILRQMRYVLRELDYPVSRLNINIVYNTPKPIEPLETQMKEMESQYSNLKVIKVPKSTSKADNINHFLTLPSESKIIAIFDTDHYPSRQALKWVARRFIKGDVDIVQGRCCIYNFDESWVTRLVAAEFDTIYGVFHPGRANLHGFGLFGGSNGYWNASLLRSIGMQKHMLTEDIDSTLRAITSGARIAYDLKVISYETAPDTIAALLKQRLRWAQGWTQVSIRHFVPAMRRGAYGSYVRSRLGLFFLLAFRELYFYFLSHLFFLLFSSFLTHVPRSWTMLYKSFLGFKISAWILVFNFTCIAACTCITVRNRSDFTRPSAIYHFGAISPVYFTIVTFTSIFCHFREVIKFEKWNPTARSAPKGKTATV
ncbi:hypothetical protein OC846_002272 [Tilletia horrida]|uniref:Glycosyltransferase 2-like domain-containing protein n=1 Tax=Tilletia horrida TaxID=155126 RepID=A0AAN6JV45_9BASI|nr:hypothetical protein OC845_004547 [Tilletia horrida]KAK0554051.1 hypothetical protein OC846_002272 [Tilletia horrida]KAK0568033.1 hypothetical protein OC861_002348 [Tilletia horrida]